MDDRRAAVDRGGRPRRAGGAGTLHGRRRRVRALAERLPVRHARCEPERRLRPRAARGARRHRRRPVRARHRPPRRLHDLLHLDGGNRAARRSRRVAARLVEPARTDASRAGSHRFRMDPGRSDLVTEALKLWVYFGETQLTGPELTSDALMDVLARRHVAVSALCRGIEGFGLGRRIHTERFPDVSTDPSLVACAVDSAERIQALLDDVDDVVADGLVTLEHTRMATGEEVAGAEFPRGPGRAGKLTIYCGRSERAVIGRRPAYREAVEILRRHGAAGATVLLGVDGTYHGWRRRATFFSPRRDAPLMIISVGRTETLAAALPELSEALEWPFVTLERIAQLKHDGEQLEELPRPPDPGHDGPSLWQTIRVYTRQAAQVDGRALYTRLTRRLREAGAAGVTTIRGHWGFSSDEPPHGDKFARLTSHAPTYSTYIDRPAKIAEVWPTIDELTAEHGIVTSVFVPAYRERRGERGGGALPLAQITSWRRRTSPRDPS